MLQACLPKEHEISFLGTFLPSRFEFAPTITKQWPQTPWKRVSPRKIERSAWERSCQADLRTHPPTKHSL